MLELGRRRGRTGYFPTALVCVQSNTGTTYQALVIAIIPLILSFPDAALQGGGGDDCYLHLQVAPST